jgi:FK506-binding nuclear protein
VPGGGETFVAPAVDIRVTNISFGEELADANGRSVVKLAYKALTAPDSDDEEEEEDKDEDEDIKLVTTVLTALTAGKASSPLFRVQTNLISSSDRAKHSQRRVA